MHITEEGVTFMLRHISKEAIFNMKTNVSEYYLVRIFVKSVIQKCSNVLTMDPIVSTVQSFNSCTSRPGVCQYLVVHTPMANMSKR